MPKVVFVSPNGARREIGIPEGWTLMEGAVQNNVQEVAAECGGGCACATCHVFIEPAWISKLPAPAAAEQDLLDCTAVPRQENSRLSCQVKLTPELEGLVVMLPERQT